MNKNVIGKKYGLWEVLSVKNNVFLTCRCECGTVKDVRFQDLERGKSKSCGCFSRRKIIERNTVHGLSKTRLYKVYKSMKSRCLNRNNKRYNDYGGRGIKISEDWIADFQNFYNWSMQNGYKENLTIDRINNDGDYCPENCRWTSVKEQNKNKRNNIKIGGICLKEWCKKNNFIYSTVYDFVRNHRSVIENNLEDMLEKYREMKNDGKSIYGCFRNFN